MRRREFIALLGGPAAAWPIAARAQQRTMPVVGFLSSGTGTTERAAAFRQGLKDTGFVEGQNVAIEFRLAEDQIAQVPAQIAELVRRQVAVIFAGNNASAVAAKAATSTIPVVFAIGGDPVNMGLVASFSRPDGNVTGVSFLSSATQAKRLELLRELVPSTAVIAALINPANPNSMMDTRVSQEAAHILGLQLLGLNVSNERDIDTAFATLVQRRAGALVIEGDPLLANRAKQLSALALRHAIPAIYPQRDFPEVGGLMSYGAHLADAYRIAGIYTGRILKGDKPADLPVQQSTKVELTLNNTTAKALGIDFPCRS